MRIFLGLCLIVLSSAQGFAAQDFDLSTCSISAERDGKPAAITCAGTTFTIDDTDDGIEFSNVINGLALQLWQDRRYNLADALFRSALDIRRRVLGEDHPDTATSYKNFALNLDSQGRFDQGEPFLRKALEIRKRSYLARTMSTPFG